MKNNVFKIAFKRQKPFKGTYGRTTTVLPKHFLHKHPDHLFRFQNALVHETWLLYIQPTAGDIKARMGEDHPPLDLCY